MDGVFINLTNEDVILCDINNKELVVKCDKDLITPSRYEVVEELTVCTESPTDKYIVRCSMKPEYVKYSFTDEQIIRINEISQNKTRLFLMSEEDANSWSLGKFKCPFRNYRIFTVSNDGYNLTEYQKPLTYLDTVVNSAAIVYTSSKKIYSKVI